ncbi:hypothetical protein KGP36_06410 [Patescibacteria group bacterium]|nr:hypothetical protein [Patescibacteria group bacterium]
MDISTEIQKLKQDGLTVRIQHERATPTAVKVALAVRGNTSRKLEQPEVIPTFELKQKGLPVSPFSGRTTVRILEDDQLIAKGVAICSPRDNFVKRVGLAKALGRALADLRREC